MPVFFVSLVDTLLTCLGKVLTQNLYAVTSYTVLLCLYLNSLKGNINYKPIYNL